MEPLNIQRLVRQNQQYAEASQHAQSITRGSIVSGWHEKHDMKGHGPGAGDRLSCKETSATAEVIASTGKASSRSTSSSSNTSSRGAARQELEHAKQARLQGRQQRLEQLYRQERLQHEMELQGLGLALQKQQH